MKYVLYSDIHAQMPQLLAVQEAAAKENADKVIVAGDLIMLGPEPAEVVENIRSQPDIDVICGNLDLWVTEKRWETHKPKSPHQAWMFDMARQTREMLTDSQLHWLRTLPFTLSYVPEPGNSFLIFHGTPHDIGDEHALPQRLTDDEVLAELGGVRADVMAFGHIHAPFIREVDGMTLVCVAGVGMAWDGDPRPAYAVVEYLGDGKWHTETKRVDFAYEDQAKLNENCWIEHGERIALMIRTGRFWNPEHMPH